MSIILGENRYGKSRVRVMKVWRDGPTHTVSEWSVDVWLQGDFTRCFEQGDNSELLPTDTMKNTVYSLARASQSSAIEEFGIELVSHFLSSNAYITAAGAAITATHWKPMEVDGQPSAASFTHGDDQSDTATVTKNEHGEINVESGFDKLWLLKTAKSGFSGFFKDRLTTLKETNDRLFGTLAKGQWRYTQTALPSIQFQSARNQAQAALLRTFAEHDSLSVQQTLHAMAAAALNTVPEIEEVHLAMPNKHCNLIDLAPFGQDNPNIIFVPTDEPHGTIEARIRRSE